MFVVLIATTAGDDTSDNDNDNDNDNDHRPVHVISEPFPRPGGCDEMSWHHRGHQRPDFAIEPGEGQESVWDYPRPPSVVADPRRIEVRAGAAGAC